MKTLTFYYIKSKSYLTEINNTEVLVMDRAVYQHKKYRDKLYVQSYPSACKETRLYTTQSLAKAIEVRDTVTKAWGGRFKIYKTSTDEEVSEL